MRRVLATAMPGLSAVYGLTWLDVWSMPRRELEQYLDQLPQWTRVISSGALEIK